MRARENGRRNDAPDLEPVFRGAIARYYYIFLRDFSYIIHTCYYYYYYHLRARSARGHNYIIMILSCAYTGLLRPGVTEEATTRML